MKTGSPLVPGFLCNLSVVVAIGNATDKACRRSYKKCEKQEKQACYNRAYRACGGYIYNQKNYRH
jgi:hypothetical protein